MNFRLLTGLLSAAILTGCASNYDQYAMAQIELAKAKADADKARYYALQSIAEQGDATAKVAAVMSMQMMGQQQTTALAAPRDPSATALQWASLLVPTLGQAYAVHQQTQLGKVQSNNNTAVAMNQSDNFADVVISGQNTDLGIAELITIPEAVVVTNQEAVIVEQETVQVVNPEVITIDPYIVNPVVVEPVIVTP